MALVAVLVALPQLVALVWWDGTSRHQAAQAVLSGMLERSLSEPEAEQACTADPVAWTSRQRGAFGPSPHEHREPPPHLRKRGPRPGPPPRGFGRHPVPPPRLEVYALDHLPDDVHAALPSEGQGALAGNSFTSEVGVVVRTGWDGPCAVAVVRGGTAPGFLGSVLPATPLWVGPGILVATVMLLAVGPPVRRLRTLTQRVQEGEGPYALTGR